MNIQQIKLTSIHLDGGTQSRAALDPATVEGYAAAMREGATFPPVTVFQDGPYLWLSDGFHRVAAAGQVGAQEIAADLRTGNARAARLHGLGANKHGLRMTTSDKRAAVSAILDDPEWSAWSDRKIAVWVDVSRPFVAKMRAERVPTVGTPAEVLRPWIPEEGQNAVGWMDMADGTSMVAWVVPAARHEGESLTFYWIVVCRVHDGDDEEGALFTKRPVPAEGPDDARDLIGGFLRRAGFPLEDATWTHGRVSDAPDEKDDLLTTMDKRWSWPHVAFRSKQEWREFTQWWNFPGSQVAQEGKAQEERDRQALLKKFPAALALLAEEGTAADREGPLPAWIKTGPAGNAS